MSRAIDTADRPPAPKMRTKPTLSIPPPKQARWAWGFAQCVARGPISPQYAICDACDVPLVRLCSPYWRAAYAVYRARRWQWVAPPPMPLHQYAAALAAREPTVPIVYGPVWPGEIVVHIPCNELGLIPTPVWHVVAPRYGSPAVEPTEDHFWPLHARCLHHDYELTLEGVCGTVRLPDPLHATGLLRLRYYTRRDTHDPTSHPTGLGRGDRRRGPRG